MPSELRAFHFFVITARHGIRCPPHLVKWTWWESAREARAAAKAKGWRGHVVEFREVRKRPANRRSRS